MSVSTQMEGLKVERNPGIPLEIDWIKEVRVNRSAVEKRTITNTKRRTVKKDWQAAWLLKAISCIDLTTLAGDDTPGRVKRLCAKAKNPVRQDILEKLNVTDLNLQVAAVCVYHKMAQTALEALKGTNIPVAVVSTGFPAGSTSLDTKLQEIKNSVGIGATEIDIVISRDYVLTGNWEDLYNEVAEFRKACGSAHMKTILATGDLATFRNVYKASLVCMMAGADFIKTSTGKEKVNATLPVGLVMMRAIREYFEKTNGNQVGLKAAGGISDAKLATQWLMLLKEELNDWVHPKLFRIGASSLLLDIERQLEHFSSGGHYSARHHFGMG
ncbi:MAG: Deoxyribose-phosphate aldolase [Candidatus Heimdallarchaeota archaeon LC_3]|nr:MAG: Deoxyribose-phosphate aldolase [Candidatus Heimdallarchaeota archaeon LC_3]